MKMPEMQKFLKGEISKDEFKPVYDRIQAKFSKGTAVESKSTRLTNILKEADVFTATSKETGSTSVFKSKAARDAAIKAGTHEKRKDDKDGGVKDPSKKDKPKLNIFKKDKAAKGGDSSAGEKDKSNSSNLDANQIGDEISKSIGIDGTANVNNNNDIEFTFGENDRETSLFIGRDGDTYKVSIENPYGDDFGKDGDIEKFDNQSDAIAHAKKLAKKYSKELGAKEAPKSEPKDSSGGRAGNPQVNKAVRKKAEKIGLTPEKLGREEYELKMVQAAHEALTDSNFHSEARKLISIIEDNPELAKNPADDPNKPGLGEPGYEEWVKGTAWGSKYGDTSPETDELGQAAAQEAGWGGKDALDGIAFELKMRGFKDLAAKMQSVFDDEKNESSMRLTKMEFKGKE
jgi:hypothetical protein